MRKQTQCIVVLRGGVSSVIGSDPELRVLIELKEARGIHAEVKDNVQHGSE